MGRRAAVLAGCWVLAAVAALASEADRDRAAREAVVEFGAELGRELAAALQSGGPAGGIEVCRVRAREISQRLTAKSGFKVGRTSSRVRNPRNAPDPWERKVLQGFEQRTAQGQAVEGMEYSEVVSQGGKRVFRYMKAIPMGEVCLACHGDELAPEVAAQLRTSYPKDRAVGFKVGEVRGAFSLEQAVE